MEAINLKFPELFRGLERELLPSAWHSEWHHNDAYHDVTIVIDVKHY